MNIDPGLLMKLKKMDERQLADAVKMLAEAAGADEKQKRRVLDNISFIKRKIATANERELAKTAEKLTAGGEIDQAKLDMLINKLKGL